MRIGFAWFLGHTKENSWQSLKAAHFAGLLSGIQFGASGGFWWGSVCFKKPSRKQSWKSRMSIPSYVISRKNMKKPAMFKIGMWEFHHGLWILCMYNLYVRVIVCDQQMRRLYILQQTEKHYVLVCSCSFSFSATTQSWTTAKHGSYWRQFCWIARNQQFFCYFQLQSFRQFFGMF